VAAAVVLAGLVAAAWGGCSIERDYKILAFFFDGVPTPEELRAQADAAGRRRPAGFVAPLSAHPAFVERRCDECHGASTNFGFTVTGFSQLDSGICFRCHEEQIASVPRLHGPVAAQDCLWCHDPHESRFTNLLVSASPTLCLGCHQFQMERPPKPEFHSDLTRDCLECHHGHGGEGRYFLRSDWTDASPAEPETPETVTTS
jgi:predicted CXXCH cytochrome family protein